MPQPEPIRDLDVDGTGGSVESLPVCRTQHSCALCLTLLVVFAAVLPGISAEKSVSDSRLDPVPPCAALIAAAQASRIPLDRIDPLVESDQLDPGDSVTALVTLFGKGRGRTQWLVYLEAVVPSVAERSQKPAPPMVLYSSFGGSLKTLSDPAFVVVRTLGPFVDQPKRGTPAKSADKSARFALNKGFLGLGLNHAAAAFCGMKEAKTHGSFVVRGTPFSEAKIAEGRKLAAKLRLTEQQEHALIGAVPALMSYFEIVRKTPGLSEILFDILDLPSTWSLLRNRGIKDFGFHFKGESVRARNGGAQWGLPKEASVYRFPVVLELNRRPALNLSFQVTEPDPPLLACAGVVGLLAEHPGNPEKHLTFRVLSARRAALRQQPKTE